MLKGVLNHEPVIEQFAILGQRTVDKYTDHPSGHDKAPGTFFVEILSRDMAEII